MQKNAQEKQANTSFDLFNTNLYLCIELLQKVLTKVISISTNYVIGYYNVQFFQGNDASFTHVVYLVLLCRLSNILDTVRCNQLFHGIN